MRMVLGGARVDITQMGGTGRACLLLHGWGCSAELMRGPQQVLCGKMRTYAVDFPGHGKQGKADPPPTVWGVPEYAGMIRELIEQENLAPCDIVAHSFGARVAILLASEHPELVGRMVLTGAAGLKKPKTGTASFRTGLYKGLRGAVDLAEKTHLFGSLPGKGKEALVQRFGSADYRALSPEMRATFNQVISLDLEPNLSRIQAPTFLFWGANDTETPLWMGRRMAELIPDAGLDVEAGAGHFVYAERADVFARILRSFLLEGRS